MQQNIQSLCTQLKDQLRTLQTLREQKVLADLKNYLSWLNPKNWFPGMNSRVWTELSGNNILFNLCLVLFNIIRAVKSTQKQVMVTLALSMTPLKTKGGDERQQQSLALQKIPGKHERRQITDYLRRGKASCFFKA